MKTHVDFFQDLKKIRKLGLMKSGRRAINLCSLDQLKQRMAVEKRRSEREGYKSSTVYFSLQNLIDKQGPSQNLRIEDVAKLICRTIRSTDMISIYSRSVVLMILFDADPSGAQSACRRIVEKVKDRYSSDGRMDPSDFSIKILSFPERKSEKVELEDSLGRPSSPVLSQSAAASGKISEMTFKRTYLSNLNLCISSYNGSLVTMPMEKLFSLDNELVHRYVVVLQKLAKRWMDILGSLTTILLLSPVMAAVALGVKCTSRGPVFFKQSRVGYQGKTFMFYKFRSMVTASEDNIHRDYVHRLIAGERDQINLGTRQNPFFKLVNDPRITPFGRFLRKTSLDELPQLFNVLKGEMSLVGPRPPIPYEVNDYKNWHYRRILAVKPGITGLWQVSGRNRTTFDEMVRLDIHYAENWSLLLDLKIIVRTLKVILAADGT